MADEEYSEYELLRLRNIQERNKVLEEHGLPIRKLYPHEEAALLRKNSEETKIEY